MTTQSQRRPSLGLALCLGPGRIWAWARLRERWAGGASNERQDGRLLKTRCQSGWRAQM